MRSGLVRKSTAPRFMAFTAIEMSPCAVMNTMSTGASTRWRWSCNSNADWSLKETSSSRQQGTLGSAVQRLKDVQTLMGPRRATPTFPSRFPVLRIDHLFVSPGIEVHDVSAPFDPLTRVASDHLPLVMDFDLT